MGRKKLSDEENCIDLLERAVHLLRSAPSGVLLLYYLGAIPFVVGLLFFLADMAASPFAEGHCAAAALGLALLYVWMRTWHSVFCRRLLERLEQRISQRWTLRQGLRVAAFHAIYSSWNMILLPLALVVAFPLPWVLAYLNNLCIVDSAAQPYGAAAARARLAARPWPMQNLYTVFILSVFGTLIAVNLAIALIQIPHLLKSMLGVESDFTRHSTWMLNTTFLGILTGLVYLAIDPLFKAVYVLRFSAIESISSGEDLLAELKQLPPKRRAAGLARPAAFIFLLFAALPVRAAEPQPALEQEPIGVEQLDTRISQVMRDREFTWRMPRDYAIEEPAAESGFFGRFIQSVSDWMDNLLHSIGDAIHRFFDWLSNRGDDHDRHRASKGIGGPGPSFFTGLGVAFLVVLLSILGIALYNAIRLRRMPPADLRDAEPVRLSVDLDDENLVATLLEEDEWIRLAREMAAAGELRKAVRAWFLAGVSYLSRSDLLAVKPSKSNLEYRRELGRRARRRPELIPLFSDNIRVFERAWYGLHTVASDDLEQMEQNLEGLRHGNEA